VSDELITFSDKPMTLYLDEKDLAKLKAELNALRKERDYLRECIVVERDLLQRQTATLMMALERIVEADCCSCFSAMKASEALNSTRDPPTSPPTPGTSTPPQP